MTDKTAVSKLLARCDGLFNSGDQAGVGRLLHDELDKALHRGDCYMALVIYSELMGHHRMCNEHQTALQCADAGIGLLNSLSEVDHLTAGTILINAGTVFSAAGDPDRALQLYQEAERRYSGTVSSADRLWAALYNNMAAVYMAKRDFRNAEDRYLQALDILQINKNGMDSAVTCVNLAQLYAADDPADPRICTMLESALMFMDDPAAERNGYYAHTCIKCVPAFRDFGMDDAAVELEARAENIYAGN